MMNFDYKPIDIDDKTNDSIKKFNESMKTNVLLTGKTF